MATSDLAGPYIVWENCGTEGWQPKSYLTLRDAITAHRYSLEWIVTKTFSYEIKEKFNV